MSKSALAVLAISALFPSAALAQTDRATAGRAADGVTLMAFVSPERAFYESNDGKAAQARLETLQSQAAREVDARNVKLKTLQQELAQRGSVLAEGARRERQQEIDRFEIDLKRFVEDAQAQFLGVQRDLENAFLAKFGPAVDSVARKRGLLFVLNQDSGVLAWADPSLDITADVVAAVNQP
jgi:Skp family chaperone for outer membrane proteins